mmetsp:Transcript_18987/g.21149  ORF Transcript_18987/g.21149 Transcript_18987/m.21149 type:complete len:418 (+) Transcript_18987:135-1388(+)
MQVNERLSIESRLPVDSMSFKMDPYNTVYGDPYGHVEPSFEDCFSLPAYSQVSQPEMIPNTYTPQYETPYDPYYEQQLARAKYYEQSVAPPTFLTNFPNYYDHGARHQSIMFPRVSPYQHAHMSGYHRAPQQTDFVQYPPQYASRAYVTLPPAPCSISTHPVASPPAICPSSPSEHSQTSPMVSPRSSPLRESPPSPKKRSGPIRRAKSSKVRSTPYTRRPRKTRAKVVLSKGAVQCKGRNKKKNERCRNAALMEFIGPRPHYCAEHIEQDPACLYKKCCASYQKIKGDGKRCKEVVLKEFGFCHKHFHEIFTAKSPQEESKDCATMLGRVTELLTDLENEAAAAKKFDADLYQRKHKLIPKFQSMKETLLERTKCLQVSSPNSSCTEPHSSESESCTEEDNFLLYKCQQNIINMGA